MSRLYDLMLLIDATAADDRRQEIAEGVRAMLEDGGTIVEEHDWGTRRMTFEIDHRPEAEYHLLRFEGDADLLGRLNHSLKIMDGVLRFRIIKQKPGGPPVPPRPEPSRARREEEPDGRVAARAAADAPADAPVEAPAEAAADAPADGSDA